MTPLPPALLHPEDGRYTVEDAIRVWLHIWHGIPADADSNGTFYKTARRDAEKALRPLIQTESVDAHQQQANEQLFMYAHRMGISDPYTYITKPEQWIERGDLERLAQSKGLLIDRISKPEAVPPRKAPKKGYDWPKFVELALLGYCRDGVRERSELLRQTLEWYAELKPGERQPGDDRADDYIGAVLRGIENSRVE